MQKLLLLFLLLSPALAYSKPPIVPHEAVTRHNDQMSLYVATFSADWCPACEGMPDIVKKLRDEGFSVYKFDFDGHRLARLKLAVKRPPTMIIMNKGRVIKRFVGAPEKFVKELRKLLQRLKAREITLPNYLLG